MNSKYDKRDFFTFLRILIYYSKHHDRELYRTKLYKLIFLSQIFYYKQWHESLFSQNFIKTFHNIKLKDIDNFIDICLNLGFVTLNQESTGVIIECTLDPIYSIYNSKELIILKHISKHYSSKTAKDLEKILDSCASYEITPGTIIDLDEHYSKCLEKNQTLLKEISTWR